MTVPPLDSTGIAVSEVVQRVRRELALAISELDIDGKYDPSKQFHWMKYWTAKVDLQLQATNTGTIAPNASYLEPTFTFGFGATLKTEAYRSDNLSFTVAMNELLVMNTDKECAQAEQLGLLGNLGLKKWVDSSVVPVRKKYLNVGFHQPPTGKNVPIFGPGTKDVVPTKTSGVPAEFKEALEKIEKAEGDTEDARVAAVRAREYARDNDVKNTYEQAKGAVEKAMEADKSLKTADAKLWVAKRKGFKFLTEPQEEDEKKQDEQKEKNFKRLVDRIKDVSDQIKSVKEAANAAWELLPRDAPLDSITHSVKFTITASATATPNWILAHFRGPAVTAPFASAQRQRVHELTVVLGSPAEPGGKALSDEQGRQLLYQKLDSLRQGGVVIFPTN